MPSNNKDIFSLGTVYRKELDGDWNTRGVYYDPLTPFPALSHMWMANGSIAGGNKSNVYRLNYSTGAIAATASPLPVAQAWSNSSQNGTTGWIVGGYGTSAYSSIYKILLSNSTVSTATPKLPVITYYASSGPSYSGTTHWCLGGRDGTSRFSNIVKIRMSDDNLTNSPNKLNISRLGSSNSSDRSAYAWLMGGYDTTYSSNMEKLDFSTDVATLLSNKLTSVKSYAGVIDETNSAWIVGGRIDTTTTISTIEKLSHFMNITEVIPATLPTAISSQNVSQDSTYGWIVGGSVTSTVNKLTMSSSTISAGPNSAVGTISGSGTF